METDVPQEDYLFPEWLDIQYQFHRIPTYAEVIQSILMNDEE